LGFGDGVAFVIFEDDADAGHVYSSSPSIRRHT
jgi:hypothetical protein